MRIIILILLVLLSENTRGSYEAKSIADAPTHNNVFIITLDGFRWQELFGGADEALINDTKYTKDTAAAKKAFWSNDIVERRQKLMPFFWNVIAGKGQIFGNRAFGNQVNVSNIYKLSYPGYNEILTGQPDLTIFSNERRHNKNKTVLEYVNKVPAYEGRVAAFASWNLFSFILNKNRSGLHINCHEEEHKKQHLAAKAQPQYYDEACHTRNDWITFNAAQDYIVKNLPKVVYLGLGGTDEYGHQKKYGKYLQGAAQADVIIEKLWQLVQSIPFYKDNTTFVITTDHGRGDSKKNWFKHGFLTKGSSQTWLALLGNGVLPLGEQKTTVQLYQKQIAGTVGSLLGIHSYRNEMIPVSYFTAINTKYRK